MCEYKEMIIRVHRGQNQIGGSILEIESGSTHIILDVGINLDEEQEIEVPQIEGLFCGDPAYDAVVISHYHSDHVGLLKYVLAEIPIYMGKQTFNIISSSRSYMGKNVDFSYLEFQDKETLHIGELTITPYKCDHSAYDSYMFLISDGSKKVLYSGDFRANGRKDYSNLLNSLPEVDALIVEGTMLSRDTYDENIQEEDLEDIAVKALEKYKGPAFLMSSAMNVDRIVTGYNAAARTGRVFLEDLYTAGIMKSIGDDVPSPGKDNIKVFMTGGDNQYEMLQKYNDCKIGKQAIAKSSFVMCVRPSMKNYLNKLNEILSFENGVLFYSMWKGYQEKTDIKDFLTYMEGLGVKIHVLHTSGHADINTIDKLVSKVKPSTIVPVHTINPKWYQRYNVKVVLDEKEVLV